jgi:hypothetical protein
MQCVIGHCYEVDKASTVPLSQASGALASRYQPNTLGLASAGNGTNPVVRYFPAEVVHVYGWLLIVQLFLNRPCKPI